MGWASGRIVGLQSGERWRVAFFEVLGMTMSSLVGRRLEVSSGTQYESYWTTGPEFAGRMLNCSVCLGPFPRWARER